MRSNKLEPFFFQQKKRKREKKPFAYVEIIFSKFFFIEKGEKLAIRKMTLMKEFPIPPSLKNLLNNNNNN